MSWVTYLLIGLAIVFGICCVRLVRPTNRALIERLGKSYKNMYEN